MNFGGLQGYRRTFRRWAAPKRVTRLLSHPMISENHENVRLERRIPRQVCLQYKKGDVNVKFGFF